MPKSSVKQNSVKGIGKGKKNDNLGFSTNSQTPVTFQKLHLSVT